MTLNGIHLFTHGRGVLPHYKIKKWNNFGILSFSHLKRVVGVDYSELMPVEGIAIPCEAGSCSLQ